MVAILEVIYDIIKALKLRSLFMKKLITTVLLTLSMILLVACGSTTKTQEKNIVGTWENKDGYIELYNDKKAHTYIDKNPLEGHWSIKDNYVYIERENTPYNLKAKLSNDNSSSLEFERVDKESGETTSSSIFTKK